jgi:uncharacterized protein YcgI (DUF1989 family)
MKVQWSTGLRRGRILYTEMGRVAFSIIEDTSGAHDPLVGPTTKASMSAALGPGALRNSRDNFLAAAAKLGLSRRDVPACGSFFAPVDVIRFTAPPPDGNDPCRHGCIEAERAFELTDRHVRRGSKS